MDEDNHYGNSMAKTFTIWLYKNDGKDSLCKFNKMLSNLSHEDKIGHLFIVGIKFHHKNPKAILFNEIHTPIFEKK